MEAWGGWGLAALEELRVGATVRGLAPQGLAAVVQVQWFGTQAVEVTYKDAAGQLRSRLVYRSDEASLEVASAGRPWSFDGDGRLLRLTSEAYRIRLAHLFDPYLAVHTSRIEPLPHQITAVYGEMLPRQPLRFLLADDPGAGKTIMAGLLIKELIIRGDLDRCLIVAPGSLVEQWQDELGEKFSLSFDILTRDQIEASPTGNPFLDRNLLIARLDMLSRDPDLQEKLKAAKDWDLVVCDEAHRMSASQFAGEIKFTRRYQLGELLGSHARHFLLMSATPHNGKEQDFQLFMRLLDADRFEGKFRDGVHTTDAGDMMRRLTKEELRRFDGSALFPPRVAYTATYKLSDKEAALYEAVTTYVREEMNRADRLGDGGEQRRQNVGFALQILQRRLASSPAAIHESLKRRLRRLEERLEEEKLLRRGAEAGLSAGPALPAIAADPDLLEDASEEEIEETEEAVVDQATAARTIAELEAEIVMLRALEQQAAALRRSGEDTKWRELSSILDHPLMTDPAGNRRKLIVFTEPRDTLEYLADKIRTRLGRPEAVTIIHGGIGREDRKKAIEAFMHDKDVLVLVANDAAGEGVNLQRAHLMVNYDLPWNPNRIEQRFGRIHRIGQTEVCHLWNLVASETREGAVYARLLEKLETARQALGGRVYDVLGRLFEAQALRDLLVEAIRFGERPDVRAKLYEKVDGAVDQERVRDLLENDVLAHDTMDAARIRKVREEMERAAARRLQPHYIQSFFIEAFRELGGQIKKREAGRWEITRVPPMLRERDRLIGRGAPIQDRYERVCFEKDLVNQPPVAAFLCPGHPLLDAAIDLILERHRDLMRQGAVLVDESDSSDKLKVLLYLEHAIQDGRVLRDGQQQIVSQRLQFTFMDQAGLSKSGGPAPYLDLRPATSEEVALIQERLAEPWLSSELERCGLQFAVEHLVPEHLQEVRDKRLPEIERVEQAVVARLRREINYWDQRAAQLRLQERAGKTPQLNSARAAGIAEELAGRMERRKSELDRERTIAPLPPQIKGGALVVPRGLLLALHGPEAALSQLSESDPNVERVAMEAVFAAERALGHEPRDVSAVKCGYDIESRDPASGHLRFIEVKGRVDGADTVTVTRNEILVALNKPDAFILAIVAVESGFGREPIYVRQPFSKEPEEFAASVIFKLRDLTSKGKPASQSKAG